MVVTYQFRVLFVEFRVRIYLFLKDTFFFFSIIGLDSGCQSFNCNPINKWVKSSHFENILAFQPTNVTQLQTRFNIAFWQANLRVDAFSTWVGFDVTFFIHFRLNLYMKSALLDPTRPNQTHGHHKYLLKTKILEITWCLRITVYWNAMPYALLPDVSCAC